MEILAVQGTWRMQRYVPEVTIDAVEGEAKHLDGSKSIRWWI